MKQCPSCGQQNHDDAKTCAQCSAVLSSGDTTISMPPEPGDSVRTGSILPVQGAAELVVAKGPSVGQRFRLDDDTTSVGRDPESDIFLDDVTVSRGHALISRSADDLTISDAGSLNGTYLNGERIEKSELRHGDELWIGKYKLIFVRGT